MKTSVSMWSLEAEIVKKNWSQSDFIKWSDTENIKYVELISYYMNKENNVKTISDLLKKSNMEVSCYTILNDFIGNTENCMKDFLRDLNIASTLETPFVRVITGDADGIDPESRKIMIQRFSEAASAAADKDITLVLENIGNLSGHSKEAVDIIEEVDSLNLRINFDTANPLLADEDPVDALKRVMPYVSYVHLKDFITAESSGFTKYSEAAWRIQTSRLGRKMTGISPGKGAVNLKKIFEMLKENKYSGFVSVEYENDFEAETAVRESIEYILSAS